MEHRVAVAGGWLMWRWLCVRATGFSVDRIARLAAPESAAAADGLLAHRRELEVARREALAALAEVQRSRKVNKAVSALEAGRSPIPGAALETAEPAVERVCAAEAEERQLAEALDRQLERDSIRIAEVLAETARDPLFREALTWQNRKALHASVASLLRRSSEANDSRTRAQRRLVASYLQRYCLKNETIGFFGPVAWAEISDGGPDIDVRPGPALLDNREVFFEHWAIQSLADTLSDDWDLKPSMLPRRQPGLRVEGDVLLHPVNQKRPLPGEFARVLAECNGDRSAADIATEMVDQGVVPVVEDVYSILVELENKGMVIWRLEVPTMTSHPEVHLRELLVAAGQVGKRGLAALDELERSRERVALAAGDAGAVDEAFAGLEIVFERLTGVSATRNAGQSYAGRNLVYEDCRRDLRCAIGPGLVERIAEPLELLAVSARWFTHRIAELYRQQLGEIHRELAAECGSPLVDYQLWWTRIQPLFPSAGRSELVARASREVEARWAEIIGLDPAARRLDVSVDEVESAVRAAFAAPQPGWPSARYHSPDCMIAADDIDAIARGDYQVILGETHVAVNTCGIPVFQNQHRDPGALIRARELDLPGPMVSPVVAAEIATRADHIWHSDQYRDLEVGATRSRRPRSQVLAVGDLVVELRGEQSIVRDRDGRCSFDVIEFFDHHLSAQVSRGLPLLPPAPHLPRVTLGPLIIARESWRFDCDSLELAGHRRGAEQFVAARDWAARHQLPRRVFAKIPEETKPVFVDFESPIFVEMFAQMAGKGSTLSITEMLPAPERAWLPDSDDRRYASELRFVVLDPMSWCAKPRRNRHD